MQLWRHAAVIRAAKTPPAAPRGRPCLPPRPDITLHTV